MADGETEAVFSEAQQGAIVEVVQRLLNKAHSEQQNQMA